MNDLEFRKYLKIEIGLLETWVSEGWLLPMERDQYLEFSQADVARAQLILDLTQAMGVNDAGVDVAMGLIDQLHGLRATLRGLVDAIDRHDGTLRQRLGIEVIDLD